MANLRFGEVWGGAGRLQRITFLFVLGTLVGSVVLHCIAIASGLIMGSNVSDYLVNDSPTVNLRWVQLSEVLVTCVRYNPAVAIVSVVVLLSVYSSMTYRANHDSGS